MTVPRFDSVENIPIIDIAIAQQLVGRNVIKVLRLSHWKEEDEMKGNATFKPHGARNQVLTISS